MIDVMGFCVGRGVGGGKGVDGVNGVGGGRGLFVRDGWREGVVCEGWAVVCGWAVV